MFSAVRCSVLCPPYYSAGPCLGHKVTCRACSSELVQSLLSLSAIYACMCASHKKAIAMQQLLIESNLSVALQSLQYWLGGNSDNLENLLLNTVKAYSPVMKGVDVDVMEPQLFPDIGIWHPMAPSEPLTPVMYWTAPPILGQFAP